MAIREREREYLIKTEGNDLKGLIEQLGFSIEDRIVKIIIVCQAPDKFHFVVTRKVNLPNTAPQYIDTKWDSKNLAFTKDLVIALGFREGEKLIWVKIEFVAGNIGKVTVSKMADDRLLDLDWSVLGLIRRNE